MKHCCWLVPGLFAMAQAATYVESRQCAQCHPQIAAKYARTGMARSLARFKPSMEDLTKDNSYYHEPSQSYFIMIERDGRYFQRRHQQAPDGSPVNVMEKEIHYVVGSG